MVVLDWKCKSFKELTSLELYSILKLRNDVFNVEQKLMLDDIDDKDQLCYHLCGWEEEDLVAYTRLMPKGIYFEEASIGRVVTKLSHRRDGHGRMLMLKSIEEHVKIFGAQNLKIEAQARLMRFYNSFGFVQVSDIFIDHEQPHVNMLYSAPVVNSCNSSSLDLEVIQS